MTKGETTDFSCFFFFLTLLNLLDLFLLGTRFSPSSYNDNDNKRWAYGYKYIGGYPVCKSIGVEFVAGGNVLPAIRLRSGYSGESACLHMQELSPLGQLKRVLDRRDWMNECLHETDTDEMATSVI